ncbi:hypothetical protein [Halorubrum sp. FL23]|uniref:hypothetical protein n=1 Tax=Halorubrum sp. FL23 TaxID=3458704 RepID=UPI0040347080
MFALATAATVVLLAVSTSAVVLDDPADPVTDDVALQPGDNPYAYLDEDDELAIDISEDNPRIDAEGVNVDAVATENALFYITYDGNASAEAWIEHEGVGVTFVVDGESVESPDDAARLAPEDDAVPVGVEIDTRVAEIAPGDRLIDEISVHARVAEPEEPDAVDGASSATGGPVVSMERRTPAVREIEVRSIVGGADTDLDLDGLHVGDPGVRLDTLTFVRAAPGDASLVVRGTTEAPTGSADTESLRSLQPGVDPLGYYTVTFAEGDQPIEEATATLAVDRERLAAAGVAPGRLAVYRETDTGWERAETSVVDASGDAVRIEAVSAGSSAFAVAAERPALVPAEIALSTETVAPGEAATLGLTLSNAGPAPAENAEIRIETAGDARTVSEGPVVIDAAPGAEGTATVTVRFDDPGTYDLVLAGDALAEPAAAGTITVTEPERSGAVGSGGGAGRGDGSGSGGTAGEGESPGDEADDGTSETAPTEPAELDLADLAGLVALVAIVLATLYLVRRAPR